MNIDFLLDAYLDPPSNLASALFSVLILLTSALLAATSHRKTRKMEPSRWLVTLVLAAFAFVAGYGGYTTLTELGFSLDQYNVLSFVTPFAPLGAALFMVAGAFIGPISATVVGLFYGLGFGLWHSHQIHDIANVVFVAMVISFLLGQVYTGRLYALLRNPVIAGIHGAILHSFLISVSNFIALVGTIGWLRAFDEAVLLGFQSLQPLLGDMFAAGFAVWLILLWLTRRRGSHAYQQATFFSSLNQRLVVTFVFMTVIVGILLLFGGYAFAKQSSTKTIVNQLELRASILSEETAQIRDERIRLLNLASQDLDFITGTTPPIAQSNLGKTLLLDTFEFMTFVDRDYQLRPIQGRSDQEIVLGADTISAVNEAYRTHDPQVVPFVSSEDGTLSLDFIITTPGIEEEVAVIGRTSTASLTKQFTNHSADVALSDAYILDQHGSVIFHWRSSPDPAAFEVRSVEDLDLLASRTDTRAASLSAASDQQRHLIYVLEDNAYPWSIALVASYDQVLSDAISNLLRFVVIFAIAMGVLCLALILVTSTVGQSIRELALQTNHAASNGTELSVVHRFNDEIGDLQAAFRHLQSAYEQRLNQQKLLLAASQMTSQSLELDKAVPAILQAAVDGTGCSGARVVLGNSGRTPLLAFSNRQESRVFSPLDSFLLQLASWRKSEIVLQNQEEFSKGLPTVVEKEDLPSIMVVIPLRSSQRFYGAYYTWCDQKSHWDSGYLHFLRTLGTNLLTLLQNATLFSKVEGARRHLEAVLTSTRDAVLVTDAKDTVVICNSAMEAYFNLGGRQVIGRKIQSILPDDFVNLLNHGTQQGHTEYEAPDGRVLSVSVSEITSSTQFPGCCVAVLHDVTRFRELDVLKSEFLSGVSHDLRTPLAYMANYAALIPTAAPIQPIQQKWLDKINQGIHEMTDLIENLLDLSRLDAGKALIPAPFDLGKLLEEICEIYHFRASESGLAIDYKASKDVGILVGERQLIKQAIENLLDNAIKYAPNSGTIKVSAIAKGDRVTISVTDNGPGIPNMDQERIFERFFRVKNARGANEKGSGLGLSLVRSIAERHNGRAWCTSEVGSGSSFYFSIPIFTTDWLEKESQPDNQSRDSSLITI